MARSGVEQPFRGLSVGRVEVRVQAEYVSFVIIVAVVLVTRFRVPHQLVICVPGVRVVLRGRSLVNRSSPGVQVVQCYVMLEDGKDVLEMSERSTRYLIKLQSSLLLIERC